MPPFWSLGRTWVIAILVLGRVQHGIRHCGADTVQALETRPARRLGGTGDRWKVRLQPGKGFVSGEADGMKVSEKSLELNVGAELLALLRGPMGMRKAYLRGLTQREESQEGVDFFAQLSSRMRIFAFQFKAPKGRREGEPYRFTIQRRQHEKLAALAGGSAGTCSTCCRTTYCPRSCSVTCPICSTIHGFCRWDPWGNEPVRHVRDQDHELQTGAGVHQSGL